MNNELVALIAGVVFSAVIWFECANATKKYLVKWLAASLVMPIIVFALGNVQSPTELTVLFWPASLLLKPLADAQWPLDHVLSVWAFSISLNLLLYFVVGLALHMATRDSENT